MSNLAMLIVTKDWEKALDYCDKIIESNPKAPEGHFEKANVYFNMREYQKALEIYTKFKIIESCLIKCDNEVERKYCKSISNDAFCRCGRVYFVMSVEANEESDINIFFEK